jgi:hypothetical protein
MKNTHQDTSSIEMPLQTPDTPTSTVGPYHVSIAINLSLLFLHNQRVTLERAGCDRTPQ